MTTTTGATYRPPRLRQAINKTALYIAIIFVTAITIFPIYWMIVSTIQPNSYSLRYPPPFFPQEIGFNQFAELFAQRPIANWLKNSFVIATTSMLLVTALSVLGAYALSSLRWRGRSLFGLFLLVTQMLPEILVLVPLYILYNQLEQLNSLPALAVVDAAFALPVCIWILKGVFDAVPPEVLDAALVDGCSEFSTVWRIVLPLSLPGLVAVAVVAFFGGWNEFLYASILVGSTELMPASVGLTTLKGLSGVLVEQYMGAGMVFSILPVAFYLSMQRYIIAGLSAGAVKG
ncbi:MAG: carbohydrate ABC transporter permease [Zoogloea sp.]|nr:carbohydrate ABC transporter permease [Zoogloea sp.]